MKLHLPASLLSALLAAAPAAYAASADIPAGHGTVNVPTSSNTWKLPTTYTEKNTAFVLGKDVTIEAKDITADTFGFYKNGDYIFTSADEDVKYGLKLDYLPGTYGNRLVSNGNLWFEDLKTLTLSYYNSAKPDEKRETSFQATFYYEETGKSLLINEVDTVTFRSIQVHTEGTGALRGGLISTNKLASKAEFTNNGTISFADLMVYNSGSSGSSGSGGMVAGGAIYSGGDLSFKDNKAVAFTNVRTRMTKNNKNKTINAYGGAIAAYQGDVEFIGNESVTFSKDEAYSAGGNAYGGAISLFSNMYASSLSTGSTLNISGNKDVTFSGNWAQGRNRASYGGAIAAGSGDVINIVNNTGVVKFEGNHAEKMGGAIYAGRIENSNNPPAEINISGNNSVAFTGNYVSFNSPNEYASDVYGGAIYAASRLTIANNESVTFSGNYLGNKNPSGSVSCVRYGSAIYMAKDYSDASLIIEGNKEVIFGNNYALRWDNTTSAYCDFGSIYGLNTNAKNVFSARTGGSIQFRDAVYLMGDLSINSAYKDKDGELQSAGGEVLFTGAHVSGYIAANKYGKHTNVDAARTSTLGGNVTVHGGTLQVDGSAKVNIGGGLSVAGSADNVANVKVGTGTLNVGSLTSTTAGSADINLNAYGAMSLTGAAKVTAGQVTLTGGSLTMTDTAALTANGGGMTVQGVDDMAAKVGMTGGTLNIGTQKLTLGAGAEMNVSSNAVVKAGQVTLDGATLDMSGTANLTATAGDLTASNAAGITMTGGALSIGSKKLTLDTGAEMNLSGSAAVTAGQVTLTDATLKMQGGTLTATDDDLVVRKSSPEVALADEGAAEKTYDVSVTGGTLDIGGQTLDLGSGTSMELSGGQVIAGKVKLEGAALDMAGDAKLTASGQVTLTDAALTMDGGTLDASAQGIAVQNAGIKMTGGTLNNGEHALALGSGTSLELSGSAAVTAEQVTLTDATLKMQGGTLTAAGGDLVVRKNSPEVALADEGAAEKTYDVSVTGGTLDIGGQTLDLGSGTSMELSGGQVTAGQVTLDAATLEMGGTAKLTATSGDLSVVNAGGISMTGGTLDIASNKLELGTGAEMDMSGGQVTAGQVALTGAKLTIGGEAQVEALGGIEAQKAELVMQGGSLNAGTLVLVDATLQMDAGVIDASTGGVSLSDSASLVLNGGSLNVGKNHIELGADMKLSLGESALVSAGKITVKESATFSVSAASSGKTAAPLAQTLTPVDNMDPTLKGAMLSADLELMGGSTYDATGGSVSLGDHELTLSTSDASKINLVLTLDSLSDPDAQIIIFSDVAMVNFLFNLDGAPVVAGEDGNVSVSASNYFDNDWKDDYYINFDKAAGLVYLSSGLPSDPSEPGATPGTPAVPEPSSTALGLMALAGLAMRRRRK